MARALRILATVILWIGMKIGPKVRMLSTIELWALKLHKRSRK